MFIGEIIKKYRENNNLSQRGFASRTSLSPSYINTLEKIYNPKTGKPYSVTIDATKEIAKAMFVSVDQLLALIDGNQIFELNSKPLSELQKTQIPVLGKVKAGYDYLANENIIGHIYLDSNPSDVDNYYALQITGDSMEPLFSDGDIAIVHKQDDFESGNTCIILVNGEEATVKKVIKRDDGIELIAMNPYYPKRCFSKNEMDEIPVKIIGKVVEARKRKIFE